MNEALIQQARVWLKQDPDPQTRTELETILANADWQALQERFDGALEFGTAGLRGLLGCGPQRMNRVMVTKAAAATLAWLQECIPDAQSRGICIGYDARKMSREFANDAARIARGTGFVVYLFDDVVPTPLLAFAHTHLHSAAALMITASHNPPEYNGCKVYWHDGAQIVPPHDIEIKKRMDAIVDVREISQHSAKQAADLNNILSVQTYQNMYVQAVANAFTQAQPTSIPANHQITKDDTSLNIAYTALHGVGEHAVRAVFDTLPFAEIHSVAEQAQPDGNFPTTDFPNPEEPGAMDQVLALAETIDADLVLANDPDADRLAIAVRHKNEMVPLNGDEIGCLLAHYVLQTQPRSNKDAVLSSIVSSPMLGMIAKSHGSYWEQTLTGHKWLQHRTMQLEREGYRCLFSYEEALGYSAFAQVRDKDGISAALLAAHAVHHYRQYGETLIDVLHDLWRKHGMFLNQQVSVHLDAQAISERMQHYRNNPPDKITGYAVNSITDVLTGTHTTKQESSNAMSLPPSNLLIYELQDGHRVMIRPSGTEPKLKYYLCARIDLAEDEEILLAKARGQKLIAQLATLATPS